MSHSDLELLDAEMAALLAAAGPFDVREAPRDPRAASIEIQTLIEDALDTIETPLRAVLVKHCIEGCSVPDTARALRIPVHTVHARLRRALEQFKAAVQPPAATGKDSLSDRDVANLLVAAVPGREVLEALDRGIARKLGDPDGGGGGDPDGGVPSAAAGTAGGMGGALGALILASLTGLGVAGDTAAAPEARASIDAVAPPIAALRPDGALAEPMQKPSPESDPAPRERARPGPRPVLRLRSPRPPREPAADSRAPNHPAHEPRASAGHTGTARPWADVLIRLRPLIEGLTHRPEGMEMPDVEPGAPSPASQRGIPRWKDGKPPPRRAPTPPGTSPARAPGAPADAARELPAEPPNSGRLTVDPGGDAGGEMPPIDGALPGDGGESPWSSEIGPDDVGSCDVESHADSIAVDVKGNNVVTGRVGEPSDVLVVKLDSAGRTQWSRQFGGAGSQKGLATAVDAQGSIVVAGWCDGALDFEDGGPALDGPGIFVAKLSAEGIAMWSALFATGEQSPDRLGLAVDGSGDVLLTGAMSGKVDFGGGPLESAGGQDVFVVKLDAGGHHVWSTRSGGLGEESGIALTVATTGDVLVTGSFESTIDFGGGPLSSAGSADMFVVRLSASGEHVWSRRFGGGGIAEGLALVIDGNEDVLATGSFTSTADFGGGVLTSAGNEDIFALKLDAAGQHVWSTRFGGPGTDRGLGVAVDGADNILVAGSFEGSVDVGTTLESGGAAGAFVVQVDPDGGHIWSRSLCSTSLVCAPESDAEALGIAVDVHDNAVVAGSYGMDPLESSGFVVKLSP